MPARKMRIELFDNEGNRYSITFEGQMTRDKVVRLLDLVELLGGMPPGGGSGTKNASANDEPSKYERVQVLLQKQFPLVWFSSREVQNIYEQEYKQPIGLSTVATYLTRMADKGMLSKIGASNSLKYRVVLNAPQVTPKQKIS
jgi:hypothetical protein